MATDWTEMQAQLDQLKAELTEVTRTELRGTEERLGDQLEQRLSHRIDEQLGKRLQAAEGRLSGRFEALEKRLSQRHKIAVDEIKRQVKLLGGAYGGTLDAINRRIQALEENVGTTLKDHARILATHSRQIDELNRRSGH